MAGSSQEQVVIGDDAVAPRRPARSFVFPLTCVALALVSMLPVVWIRFGPAFAFTRQPSRQPYTRDYGPGRDPELGKPAPRFELTSIDGKRLDPEGDRPTVLLFVDACTDCSVSVLYGWQKVAGDAQARLIVVSHDTVAGLKAFQTAHPDLKAEFVAGDDPILEQLYRATNKPRAFVINRAGSLLFVQAGTAIEPEAYGLGRAALVGASNVE